MKRRHEDTDDVSLTTRKRELEDELKEIAIVEEERVRKRFSLLEIPTEIWMLIFNQVDDDDASLWLTLLTTSKSVPIQWREAITMRRSLSFPPKLKKSYNSEKVMKLIIKFPSLQRIKLCDNGSNNNRHYATYFHFSEMRMIEELSFYASSEKPFPKQRGRIRRPLPIEDVSILENIRVLDISNLCLSIANDYLEKLPVQAKENLRELKVCDITQRTLATFPNLYTLDISKSSTRVKHLNENVDINKLYVKSRTCIPQIKVSRYIEISVISDNNKRITIIYRGNLTFNEKGICSNNLSVEITTPKKRSTPIREAKTYIFTGKFMDGQAKGEFTKMRKGKTEVKIIKDIEYDKHLYFLKYYQ